MALIGTDFQDDIAETITMDLVARLFGEAWEYRRRRHRALVAGILLVGIAVAAGLLLGRGGNKLTKPALAVSFRSEPSSRVLAFHNVILVGSLSSDATVVTVVLKRPGASVVASVDGRVIDLRSFTSEVVHRPNTGFTGKLKSARTSNQGVGIPASGKTVAVRLRISYPDGSGIATGFNEHFKHLLGTA